MVHVEQGGLKAEKDDMEFAHQYFVRGQEGLLEYIKRKVSYVSLVGWGLFKFWWFTFLKMGRFRLYLSHNCTRKFNTVNISILLILSGTFACKISGPSIVGVKVQPKSYCQRNSTRYTRQMLKSEILKSLQEWEPETGANLKRPYSIRFCWKL